MTIAQIQALVARLTDKQLDKLIAHANAEDHRRKRESERLSEEWSGLTRLSK